MNLFQLTGEILLNGVPQAENQLKDVSSQANKASDVMGKAFKKIGIAVASAFSVATITKFGKALVLASADVSNEVGTFQNVFGKYSDTVMKSMEKLSKKTGVVSTRLMNNITTISSKFRTLGYSMEESIDLASDSLSMATDLASYWGMELSDAIDNLDAFMNGQYKMARNIGIYADDASVAQYAVQQGIIKTTKEFSSLTDAMQQNIRLGFAKETMKNMGALDSASNGANDYLNVVGNLNETWRQFKATLGEPILQNIVIPAMKTLSDVLDTLKGKVDNFKKWMNENSSIIDTWTDRIIIASTIALGFLAVLGAFKLIKQIGTWFTNLSTLLSVALSNPFVLVIAGLVTLGTVLVEAYKNNEDFRNKVNECWEAVKSAINPIIDLLVSKFGEFPKAQGIVEVALEAIKKAIDGVVWVVQEVVLPIISGLAKFISDNIDPITTIVGNVIDIVKASIQGFLSLIKGDWEGVWDSIVEIFSKTWESIKIIIEPVVDWLKGVFDLMVERFVEVKDNIVQKINDIKKAISEKFTEIKETISSKVSEIKETISSKVSEIKDSIVRKFLEIKEAISEKIVDIKETISEKFTNIVESVKGFGKNIVEGLWSGIEGVRDWFIEKWENSFLGGVVSGAKNFLGVHSPSTVFAEIGGYVVEGLEEGIEKETPNAVDYIGELGDKLVNALSRSNLGRRILKAYGIEIVESVVEGVEEAEPIVESTSKSLWDKIKAWWNGKKKSISDWWKDLGDDFKSKVKGIKNVFDLLANAYNEYIGSLFSAIESYQEQIMQNQIDSLESQISALKEKNEEELSSEEEKSEEEKKLLKNQLYSGKISYADYVKSIQKLDDELEKSKKDKADAEAKAEADLQAKKDELGRKAFEANKKTEISNVWINTASAILKAYAEMGYIFGSVASALLLTTAGIQTATISSQQYTPALAEGGIVDEPTTALIGEDGKEAVVPLENNLEWVSGLASALQPVVADTRIDYKPAIYEVRDVLQEFKESVVGFLEDLVDRESSITIDGRVVAQSILPYMNTELGNLSRLRARGI